MHSAKRINFINRAASPWVMWLIAYIGAAALWRIVPEGTLFSPGGIFGAIILAIGLTQWIVVLVLALRVHPRAARSVYAIQEMVTAGPYALVRHPLYGSDILLAWCIFFWMPAYRILAVVVWITALLLFWASMEEWLLEKKFLNQYRAYKERVPMLMPRIRKR